MTAESGLTVLLFVRDRPNDLLRVTAEIDDRRLKVFTYDLSAMALEAYGDDDLESWVTVEKAAWPKLLLALLQEKLGGNPGAERAFLAFCQSHGIPCTREIW